MGFLGSKRSLKTYWYGQHHLGDEILGVNRSDRVRSRIQRTGFRLKSNYQRRDRNPDSTGFDPASADRVPIQIQNISDCY